MRLLVFCEAPADFRMVASLVDRVLREEGPVWVREHLEFRQLRIVIGCPDLEREAWVLAGFEPENAAERARLDGEHGDLGFSPCEEAHRLRDKDDRGQRSPKRVLAAFTSGEAGREERCWTDTPLERLRARGVESGLRRFLDEVAGSIVPLFETTRSA